MTKKSGVSKPVVWGTPGLHIRFPVVFVISVVSVISVNPALLVCSCLSCLPRFRRFRDFCLFREKVTRMQNNRFWQTMGLEMPGKATPK